MYIIVSILYKVVVKRYIEIIQKYYKIPTKDSENSHFQLKFL